MLTRPLLPQSTPLAGRRPTSMLITDSCMTAGSTPQTRSTTALDPTRKRTVWLWIVVATACVALTLGGHALGMWVEQALGLKTPDVRSLIDGRLFVGLLLIYIVLLAVPFVPGAEVAIFLLMVFGAEAAIPVYGATVTALLLSFMAGRLIPLPLLLAGLRRVGLSRAADVLTSDVNPAQNVLNDTSRPGWTGAILDRVLKHRCIALGVLINTPGNSIVGGGGGIALAVGASRLLTFPQFFLTVLIAVAPVPAVILIAAVLTSA